MQKDAAAAGADGIPQRVCGVVSGPEGQLLCIRDGQIGRADHPAPGIPARCAENAHQLQLKALHARLLEKLPGGGGLHRLIFIGKAPGQGQLSQIRMAAPADQEQLQPRPLPPEDQDVGGQGGLGIIAAAVAGDGLGLGQAPLVT